MPDTPALAFVVVVVVVVATVIPVVEELVAFPLVLSCLASCGDDSWTPRVMLLPAKCVCPGSVTTDVEAETEVAA